MIVREPKVRFVLTLEGAADTAHAHTLRYLLKYLLRSRGLRCTEVRQLDHRDGVRGRADDGFRDSEAGGGVMHPPATPASAHPLAVYDGRVCVGFIRPRGDAFEALDLDRRSLGLFPSRSEAADAIEETRRR